MAKPARNARIAFPAARDRTQVPTGAWPPHVPTRGPRRRQPGGHHDSLPFARVPSALAPIALPVCAPSRQARSRRARDAASPFGSHFSVRVTRIQTAIVVSKEPGASGTGQQRGGHRIHIPRFLSLRSPGADGLVGLGTNAAPSNHDQDENDAHRRRRAIRASQSDADIVAQAGPG